MVSSAHFGWECALVVLTAPGSGCTSGDAAGTAVTTPAAIAEPLAATVDDPPAHRLLRGNAE